MANGASRIFNVINNTSENNNPTTSRIISLTVKSLNPIIFIRDDKLEITEEFCYFNALIDKSLLQVGDIVEALVLSNGQQYLIQHNTNTKPINQTDIYNLQDDVINMQADITEAQSDILEAQEDISDLNTITSNLQTNLRKQDYLNIPITSNFIVSGDDLNDYINEGIYASTTGAISASLSNTPVTESGFKLIVEYLHDVSRIRQTIYANSAYSYTYIRTYTQSGWGNWIKMPNYNIYEKPLTSIPSNSNLNNYTTAGTYFCPNGTVAQTLSNCPFTGAFKLIIDHLHDASRIRQTIYGNSANSDTFIRTYTGSWGGWRKITTTAV